MTINLKAKFHKAQAQFEEKLNSIHEQLGESLNSRQIFNDFLKKVDLEVEELIFNLENDN